MVSFSKPDPEPTPEFNRLCLDVIQHWEHGAVPYEEVITRLDNYRQEAIAHRHLANEARAEHALGYTHHYCGNLSTSIQHYERARDLYSKVSNRYRMAMVDLNQGENFRYKGNFNKALRLYHNAYTLAHRLGHIQIQTLAALNEGLVHLTTGHHNEAWQNFQTVLNLAPTWDGEPEKLAEMLCEVYHGLALLHLRAGEMADALDAALESLEIARQTGQPLLLGHANRTMGEVVTQTGGVPMPDLPDDPDDYFRAALSFFKDMDAEAEIARAMFAQARSLIARNRRTTAARKLQQAMIIFTRLEMVDDAARAAEMQRNVL